MTIPKLIAATTLKVLAQHLHAIHVLYREFVPDESEKKIAFLSHYGNEKLSLSNQSFLKDFEKLVPIKLLSGNETLIVTNFAGDQRLNQKVRRVWKQHHVSAAIAVSCHLNRNLVAQFVVYHTIPKKWTEEEVRLVNEVAQILSLALERCRNEQILQKNTLKINKLRLEKQRELIRSSLHALEEERNRISEIVHHSIGQLLYGINLTMSALKPEIKNNEFQKSVKYVKEMLNQAILETRRLSHELTPTTLEEFGIKKALDAVCAQLSYETMFSVQVTGLEGRLDRPLELSIYRMVQELMINVHKHAQAERCEVYIDVQKQNIYLSIKDNGNGVPSNMEEKFGIGLSSIRNKVKKLGGQFKVAPEPGKGTRISITIPHFLKKRKKM